MSEEEFISGPHRVDQPHPELPQALADLLGRVTVAGGATGFTADTELETLTDTAQRVVDDASTRPKRRHILTAGKQHTLAGAVVLRVGEFPVERHRAEVEWLLVDPQVSERGVGEQLLDAAESHAVALGLAQLTLRARSDAATEQFYSERGWTERGRWPRSLRTGDEQFHDEVWLTRDL
ncbi:GNAT family N-acetyltransferase [Actinopolyspora saharensis]|uniref:Acetyltransferase (GNAT) domain-containing protein n=1 Tax=Actinopolyspora saharensis TaxID=995062 RepID=A0A1H1DI74_9ACTN|nr:GNAT family N-acetyltransferase [Actinopolyspora saharensis]SDQ76204.1 Acetyltransferase (GNAT) domain-containing protein [Actinopolyspora saharensis]